MINVGHILTAVNNTALLLNDSASIALTSSEDNMEWSHTTLYQSEPLNATYSRNDTDTSQSSDGDSVSIMWYMISFGGLITFFLLLSFSEVCCRRKSSTTRTNDVEEDHTSPPPYELFAPPNYDSLFRTITEKKIRPSVYLIPVHFKQQATREKTLEFGEVIARNAMGDGEVVTPPPPP